MHQAHLCLHHDVVACSTAVGARLAITGDAGVNETRVQLIEGLEVQLVFFQSVREIIFHKDVTVFDESVKNFDTGRVCKG